MLRWSGRATHVSARSLILSRLITGLDGGSNFKRNGGALAPLLHLPLAHCYGQKPAGDPNPGSSQKKQRVDRMESNPGL